MKTLMNISAVTMMLTTSVLAQTQWIETAFWKAPQATSFTLKLRNREKLSKACTHFKNLVYKADGSLNSWVTTNPQRMESFRKPIDPVFIDVDLAPYKKLEKVVILDDSVSENSKLPHFTQTSAKTGVNFDEFTSIKASVKQDSYTQFSRDLQLSDSDVEMTFDGRAMFVLNIKGMDLACDLYEGKGTLEVKAPAYIVLTDDGHAKLSDFYNQKLMPEISDLFNAKKEGVSQRAIRLGYRTGKILEDEFPNLDSKSSEKLLLEVTKTLFNPKTLEATSNVAPNDGKPFVVISDSEEAKPVTVKLEF